MLITKKYEVNNMKNIKKFFSVFILVSLCASSSFLCVGCGDPEPPAFMQGDDETFSLTEIVEAGVYKNMDESMEDHLIINDDNTISLVNFDGHKLANDYTQNLSEVEMTEEEFCELLKTPYDTIVRSEDVEEMYSISVGLFGDDAPVRIRFKYNSNDKTIFFHRNLYKIETNEQDD